MGLQGAANPFGIETNCLSFCVDRGVSLPNNPIMIRLGSPVLPPSPLTSRKMRSVTVACADLEEVSAACDGAGTIEKAPNTAVAADADCSNQDRLEGTDLSSGWVLLVDRAVLVADFAAHDALGAAVNAKQFHGCSQIAETRRRRVARREIMFTKY